MLSDVVCTSTAVGGQRRAGRGRPRSWWWWCQRARHARARGGAGRRRPVTVVVLVVLVVVECVVVVVDGRAGRRRRAGGRRRWCWSSPAGRGGRRAGGAGRREPEHGPVSVGGEARGVGGSVPQSSSRRSKTPSWSRSTPMRVAAPRRHAREGELLAGASRPGCAAPWSWTGASEWRSSWKLLPPTYTAPRASPAHVALHDQVAVAGVGTRHQQVDAVDERRGVEGGGVDRDLLADRRLEPGVEGQEELLDVAARR